MPLHKMAVAYIVFPSSVLSAVRYHKDINFPFMNIGNNFTHTQVQFEFGSGPMIFFTELCPLNFEIIFCAIKCKTKYDIWNFGCLWGGGGAFLSLRHIYVLLYDNLQQNKLYNALNFMLDLAGCFCHPALLTTINGIRLDW